MYQQTIIVGNVGKEPEMRYTPNGKAVTSFSVATSEGSGDGKKTTWFRVTAWDKLAELVSQYVHKGSKVLVEGRLAADADGNPRTWQDKEGNTRASFELTASTVRFLSSNPGTGETAEPESEIPF